MSLAKIVSSEGRVLEALKDVVVKKKRKPDTQKPQTWALKTQSTSEMCRRMWGSMEEREGARRSVREGHWLWWSLD